MQHGKVQVKLPLKRIRKVASKKLFEYFCEHCGAKDPLEYFGSLSAPFENLKLCTSCADLPLCKITRKSLDEIKKLKQEML